MANQQPAWPLIVKLADDSQLRMWHSADDVSDDELPKGLDYTLADANGNTWTLESGETLEAAGRKLELETLLQWLQGHAEDEGNCCIAKLYAPDYPAAMVMAQSIIKD